MSSATARNIMSKDVVTVSPDVAVKDLAELLAEKNIGGAPVVDETGKLVGVVTESDLILQDARIHYPSYIHLLDGFIYWPGSAARFNDEFKKALGATVRDIMSENAITAGPDATLEDLATLMTDRDIDRIPIVDPDGKLAGIVTKHDLITAISKTT